MKVIFEDKKSSKYGEIGIFIQGSCRSAGGRSAGGRSDGGKSAGGRSAGGSSAGGRSAGQTIMIEIMYTLRSFLGGKS